MSNDLVRPTALAGKADPFLIAMLNEAARKEPAVNQPEIEPASSVMHRSVGLVAVVLALLLSAVALIDGARRPDSDDLASRLASLPDSVTMPVQSPFVDTSVRLIENQSAALWQQQDGTPGLRLAQPGDGALAALVNADGIPVALAVVPPGLASAPNRLLVSPISSALAVAATHPDVLSGTSSDALGRLAVVTRSNAFTSFASLVDGSTPIASLGTGAQQAVIGFTSSLEAASSGLQPTCVAAEVPAPGVIRCDNSTQFQNTGLRSVPVLDAAGQLCGVIPPARFTASAGEQAAVLAMITDGVPFDVAAERGVVEPGTFDVAISCNGGGTVQTPSDPNQASQWRGQTELIDVVVPLARLIGGQVDGDSSNLTGVQVAPFASDSVAMRLTNATLQMADTSVNSALELERDGQVADIQLDGLIQSTVARLYE